MPRTYVLKDPAARSNQTRAAVQARWQKRRELAQSTTCKDCMLLKIELNKAKKDLERLHNAPQPKPAVVEQPVVQNAPQTHTDHKTALRSFASDYRQTLANFRNPRAEMPELNVFNLTSEINRLLTLHLR